MDALYRVAYTDPDGNVRFVDYETLACVLEDKRKAGTHGSVKAEVYKFFAKFDMYLYMNELNDNND